MSKAAATTVGILFSVLLACAAASVSAAAVLPTDAQEGKIIYFPIYDPQVKECWQSFSLIPGCVDEVFRSFIKGTITGIGPACCKVINEVADKCFPKFAGIYPFNPVFAPTIKVHCQSTTPPAAAPLSSSPLV